MTIQELVGKAQKAIRDAEEAIQALNEIVEAINLDANGFKTIELTVDAAYQILLAEDDGPETLRMKYKGCLVTRIENTFQDNGYYIYVYSPTEIPRSSPSASNGLYYEQGDAQCITIVAHK